MAKSKIYTKQGDQGSTSLVTGKKVSKAHPRLEAYGCVDELNSTIGVAISQLNSSSPLETESLKAQLLELQSQLFTLGSQLSCDDSETRKKLPQISLQDIQRMEQQIDEMDQVLPSLQNFILPGGHPVAATLHLARTVCRRAERLMTKVREEGQPEQDTLFVFINRLSDYLFLAARFCNFKSGVEEILWKNKK